MMLEVRAEVRLCHVTQMDQVTVLVCFVASVLLLVSGAKRRLTKSGAIRVTLLVAACRGTGMLGPKGTCDHAIRCMLMQ